MKQKIKIILFISCLTIGLFTYKVTQRLKPISVPLPILVNKGPCWQDICPGVTQTEEIQQIMSTYKDVTSIGKNMWLFSQDNGAKYSLAINSQADYIRSIAVNLRGEYEIKTIVEKLGYPDEYAVMLRRLELGYCYMLFHYKDNQMWVVLGTSGTLLGNFETKADTYILYTRDTPTLAELESYSLDSSGFFPLNLNPISHKQIDDLGFSNTCLQ